MINNPPVEAVVEYLEQRGFRPWPNELIISGIAFKFDAVLQGPEGYSDIVLIADTLMQDDDHEIVRQVLGIARALDMARKSNPITTIIVGRRPDAPILNRIMSVSRVLALGPVDMTDPKPQFNNWLAILTPLKLDKASPTTIDPLAELKSSFSGVRNDILDIVDVASNGEEAVRSMIDRLISDDLRPALGMDE
tara:strand:- start:1018 stop:1596 length:579 start_codon:yes stop_codon:yes gene_type:complete